ncbi:hypothetical protein ABEB36_010504 [Hypothenemus hampei]|uniref:Uncharacterized protein n=1 Tax=Hypothenemus hampei TaxID=57062 RepID=A0ABD1EJZ0_HYPHA
MNGLLLKFLKLPLNLLCDHWLLRYHRSKAKGSFFIQSPISRQGSDVERPKTKQIEAEYTVCSSCVKGSAVVKKDSTYAMPTIK